MNFSPGYLTKEVFEIIPEFVNWKGIA